MYTIKSVEIDGFWGEYRAKAEFRPDVNIIIGANGSGKTTFMELLRGVLKADPRTLGSSEWKHIRVSLVDGKSTRTIQVRRISQGPYDEVFRFKIGTSSRDLPALNPREGEPHRAFATRRSAMAYQQLRESVAQLVNVSSLSVHRATIDDNEEPTDYPRQGRFVTAPVDRRLEQLMKELTRYQLSLAQDASQISSMFQKEVLATMLFDTEYDTFQQASKELPDLDQHETQLKRAYEELGALSQPVTERIKKHVAALRKSVKGLQDRKEKALDVDMVLPLPLLRRSQKIIDLLSRAEAEKKTVFAPIDRYLDSLRGFMKDKAILVTDQREFTIQKKGKDIAVPQLASGEKQLLVLLTETLLQRQQPFVFLADEPELSLHIAWQAHVISELRKLNEKAQVIVATHSPEIAGRWRSRIIDMANVIHE